MSRRKNWSICLFTAILVAMPLAPFGSTARAMPAASTVGALPAASGDTLIGGFDVGPGGSPEVFNPITDAAGFTWLNKYFEPLVIYDVHFRKIHGFLAKSWKISRGGTQYTFNLRKGVKWQDGKPFTSADVKFTIDLYKNPDSASTYGTKLADVTKVTTPNPLTAVFTLSAPDAALLDGLTYVVMLPQHALAQYTPAALVKSSWWSTDPIGTGPFKWDKYVPGQYVELQAFDQYWGGKPKLRFLINRYFTNPESAVVALRSGEIQFTYVSLDDALALKSAPNVRVIAGPSDVLNFFGFNHLDPRFRDERIRQAFMYAIDRKTIVAKLYQGAAKLDNCVFSSTQYQPKGLNQYAYDPAKARALLQAAGWDKIKGSPVQVVTYYNDQLSLNVLTTVQSMLAQVGISVTIRAVDVPTYRNIVGGTSWTMRYAGIGAGPEPDSLSILLSPAAVPPAGANYDRVNNAAITRGLTLGLKQTNPKKRQAIYQQVCKVFNAKLPELPMWVSERFGAASTSVGHFIWTPAPGGGRYEDFAQDWTVSK